MWSVKLNVKQGKVSNRGILCPYSFCMCIFSQSADIPQLAQHLHSGRSSTSNTSENWVYIQSNMCVCTRCYSWKPNCSTLEPDWSQYNSPSTYIITQQYSSTRILEMLFQFLYFLQLQHMKVRDLKLCKAGSVCTSFMFLLSNWKICKLFCFSFTA
jgi:hypothetical protein